MTVSAAGRATADSVRPLALLLLALVSARALVTEWPRLTGARGLWDFGAFLESGRAAARGLDPYGVYPLTPRVSLPGFEGVNPNLNPPVSALLFRAFDLAPPETAFAVWTVVSALCHGLAAGLLIRRHLSGVEAAAAALWAAAMAGFLDTLYLGQIYTPLALSAAGAWLLLERGRGVAAGALIGLVAALKPNFLVWPVLLALAGHRRPALAAGAVFAAVSAAPLAALGPGVYARWFSVIAEDGARAAFLTNASLAGFAARLGAPLAGLAASAALLAGLALWALARRPDPLRASGFALVAAVLASPLGWVHYTLFLLPPILARWRRPAIWASAVALAVPVPFVLAWFGAPPRLELTVGSLYGWAVLLVLGALIAVEVRRGAARAR
jgi:hypothetical protein